jgi:hypothetical protein
MGWLRDLIGNTAGEVVDSVGNTVDRFIHTGEEKAQWELAKQELQLKFRQLEMEADNRLLKDRVSAREMYEKDSGLQKLFAIIFLGGYLVISGLLVWLVMSFLSEAVEFEAPAWLVSLISTVFGAMSAKVNTIVDFLFGGSQGERDTRRLQSEMQRINRSVEDA